MGAGLQQRFQAEDHLLRDVWVHLNTKQGTHEQSEIFGDSLLGECIGTWLQWRNNLQGSHLEKERPGRLLWSACSGEGMNTEELQFRYPKPDAPHYTCFPPGAVSGPHHQSGHQRRVLEISRRETENPPLLPRCSQLVNLASTNLLFGNSTQAEATALHPKHGRLRCISQEVSCKAADGQWPRGGEHHSLAVLGS